jgi:hypothetical protein
MSPYELEPMEFDVAKLGLTSSLTWANSGAWQIYLFVNSLMLSWVYSTTYNWPHISAASFGHDSTTMRVYCLFYHWEK